MERILYFALAALIEAGNASLLGLPRLLKDESYRADILERVRDPIIHGFFAQEYATWDDDYRTTAIDPVLNKIEQLLAAPVVRAILGSMKSSIDLTEIMDEKKIFIANLSKGLLGPGHANLLGTMLVSGFSNAAARRGAGTTKSATARVPFYLVVDEAENFVTDAFGDIVSEARKWKLSLILAHQYLEQLPHKLRAGVLANAGSILAFQLSGEDAEIISREIGLKNTALLTQLSRGEVWLKHATHGGPYHPRLLDPIATNSKGRAAALKQNRLRNTFPRDVVEAKIDRFLRA
jgi:TraM recognition site of TraD and TraG